MKLLHGSHSLTIRDEKNQLALQLQAVPEFQFPTETAANY